MTRLIRTIGFGIAALMGIGAVFGAILTMYTAVATRARESLRCERSASTPARPRVGARRVDGAGTDWRLIGGAAAYLAFNGYQTSTMNFQTFSQVAFAFRVTPELLGMGLFYALLMGLIGGLFPAIRAARYRYLWRFENSSDDWQIGRLVDYAEPESHSLPSLPIRVHLTRSDTRSSTRHPSR